MGYERYPRGNDQSDSQDSRRDFGTGREYTYSSARDYAAAGRLGRDDDDGDRSRDRYGARDYGRQSYGRQDYGQSDAGRPDYGRSDYGRSDYGRSDAGRSDTGRSDTGRADYGRAEYGQGNQPGRGGSGYGDRDYGSDDGSRDQARGGSYGGSQGFYGRGREGSGQQQGGSREYHGSYASDGRRFEDVGRYRHADDDNYRGQQQGRDQNRDPNRSGYGRQPQGYDYEDRGFLARAGDEVRSWFGDDEAERRREMDSRYDERSDPSQGGGGQSRYGNRSRHHDEDYNSWRSGQIAALDRDYDEYRSENRSKFENEFSSWRTTRQGQREQLNKVTEHQEVVGSDGAHVGTVDKVRGDRILLTKNDVDAGGQHHSIPSNWVHLVDDKVTLTKSADEAKKAWRDEDRNQAMFGYGDNNRQQSSSQHGASASSTATATTGQSTAGQSSTGQSAAGQSATDQTKTNDDDFKSDGNLNKSFSGTY